ncbi:MAG: hypothetical protein EOO41_04715, partial [Methanobacteriota archaeon]
MHVHAGNWLEDRSKAPALKGGIADYGIVRVSSSPITSCRLRAHAAVRANSSMAPAAAAAAPPASPRPLQREYSTTAASTFVAPDLRSVSEASAGRSRVRFGMVTPDTLNEAAFSYGEGAPPALRFESTLVAPARAPSEAELVRMPLSSTAREAMAAPVQIAEAAVRAAAKGDAYLHHSVLAPAAGGPGSLSIDRGRKTVGITGEVRGLASIAAVADARMCALHPCPTHRCIPSAAHADAAHWGRPKNVDGCAAHLDSKTRRWHQRCSKCSCVHALLCSPLFRQACACVQACLAPATSLQPPMPAAEPLYMSLPLSGEETVKRATSAAPAPARP